MDPTGQLAGHLTHSEPDGSVGLRFEVVEKFEVTRQVRSMSILDLSGGGFLQDDSRDRSCDSQININSEKKKKDRISDTLYCTYPSSLRGRFRYQNQQG